MFGWHHRLNGHEFEQTPGDGEGQGSLACCRPWGCKESDITERQTFTSLKCLEEFKSLVIWDGFLCRKVLNGKLMESYLGFLFLLS